MNGYYHSSCDQSLKYLAFLDVPAKKIILGYPSYAVAYGGVPNKDFGLFQSFDPKRTPTFDAKMQGRLEYSTVLKLLQTGFHEHATYENGHISAVWAYNPVTQQFLSYDNPQLVKEKANYVEKNHLAGLMTWLLNDDTPVNNSESLLKIANLILST